MATKLSRTSTTRGSITPPFPSPPSTAPWASIASTTFASPTFETWQATPRFPQMAAVMPLVEQFTTTGPGIFASTPSTASASVASSPTYRPSAVAIASRSASGS